MYERLTPRKKEIIPSGEPWVKTVRTIQPESIDFYGHVASREYLKFCQEGQLDFWRSLGLDLQTTLDREHKVRTYVSEANAKYRRPLREGDEIEIYTRVGGLKSRSMVFEHRIMRNGKEVFSGTVEVIFIDSDKENPRTLPREVKERLETFLRRDSAS